MCRRIASTIAQLVFYVVYTYVSRTPIHMRSDRYSGDLCSTAHVPRPTRRLSCTTQEVAEKYICMEDRIIEYPTGGVAVDWAADHRAHERGY